MALYTPDLSGSNPIYKVDADPVAITGDGQKITFDTPVFASSLVITYNDGSNTPLTKDVDWEIKADDIDQTTIARILVSHPTFNEVLLKSVTFKVKFSTPTPVTMTYQQLYHVEYKNATFNGQLIELTPALISETLQRVAALEQKTQGLVDVASVTNTAPKLFPIDIHKTIPTNEVAEEVHTVNVFQKQHMIFPLAGSFFRDSVTIVDSNDVPLVEGADYLVKFFNKAKSLPSNNTSGVYDAIMITKGYAGALKVTYHAYGGQPTFDDLTKLNATVQSIVDYLGESSFVTEVGLPFTNVMNAYDGRVAALEEAVRILAQTGNPQYGDSTNGTTAVHRLKTTDVKLHWFTIASMYKVGTAPDIFTKDRMSFRMMLNNAGIQADVIVSADITSPHNTFSVSTTNVLQDTGADVVYGAGRLDTVVMPQFRIIWSDDVASLSGVLLQIGIQCPSLDETLVIEDRSGLESTWKLKVSQAGFITPEDNTILLPDGATYWDGNQSTAKSTVRMMPNTTGYVAYAGATPLSTFLTETAVTHRLPIGFNIADIKSVTLESKHRSDTTVTKNQIQMGGWQANGFLTGISTIRTVTTSGTHTVGNGFIKIEPGATVNDPCTIKLTYVGNDTDYDLRYIWVNL